MKRRSALGTMAAGGWMVLPLLNSTFNEGTNQPDATKELSVRLASVRTWPV